MAAGQNRQLNTDASRITIAITPKIISYNYSCTCMYIINYIVSLLRQDMALGMRTLCWNNFGNNRMQKESVRNNAGIIGLI